MKKLALLCFLLFIPISTFSFSKSEAKTTYKEYETEWKKYLSIYKSIDGINGSESDRLVALIYEALSHCRHALGKCDSILEKKKL